MHYEEKDIVLDYEKLGADNGGYQPKLTLYFPDNTPQIEPNRLSPVVVICPGGGYAMTSDREAEPIALKFLGAGIRAAVLRYSIGNARFPSALFELGTAITMLREHATEWHIDPNKIIVCGFSAGGHLCASYGTLWNHDFVKTALGCQNEEHRPNGMILGYPVITTGEKANVGSFENLLGEKKDDPELLELLAAEKQVTVDTPPAFLWHTSDDVVVPVENSLMFATALSACQIPFELHVFPKGPHGLALSNRLTAGDLSTEIMIPECEIWIDQAIRWTESL